MADLTRWLAGDGKPPMGVFLRVVDVLIEERDTVKFIPPTPGDEQGGTKP